MIAPIEVATEKVEQVRIKVHDFTLNQEEQVQRKIDHASKAMLKVEINNEEIKIKPNSGVFKVLAEEIVKLKVGDEIRTKTAVGIVKDQHQQTDNKSVPYMIKSEFLVKDLATGFSQKAVLHTYLSQTYFMIQGKGAMQDKSFCKDFFLNNILKQFMRGVMDTKGQDIRLINKLLKTQNRPIYPNQWKRKQGSKDDKCDLCSRSFINQHGVAIHKKRVHGQQIQPKIAARTLASVKINNELKRSDSIKSGGGSSRSNSPSPKKIHMDKKHENKPIKQRKKEENKEESGQSTQRDSDQKVDFGIQCELGDCNPNVRAGLMTRLETNLRQAKEEIVELKQEAKHLKLHNARKQAGFQSEYEEILLEKQRVNIEMVKLQSQNNILIAKVESLESLEKENQVDECVANVACDGDCQHVKCNVDQAQRLQDMKNLGGRRNSPVEYGKTNPMIKCPQCNFKSTRKSEVEDHVKKTHSINYNCPFCLIGFSNHESLGRHIDNYHSENDKTQWIKCSQCNFTSQQKSEVERHINTDHVINLSCPFC